MMSLNNEKSRSCQQVLKDHLLTRIPVELLPQGRDILLRELTLFYDETATNPFLTIELAIDTLQQKLGDAICKLPPCWRVATAAWLLAVRKMHRDHLLTDQLHLLKHLEGATELLQSFEPYTPN